MGGVIHLTCRALSKIHNLAEVIETKYLDDLVNVTFRTSRENKNRIERIINEN